MAEEQEYVQLFSWQELVEWLERAGMKAGIDYSNWNPKPKRKNKKKPLRLGGLFP